MTLRAEATFSLCELSWEKWPLPKTVQIRPEIWMNKLKNGFFPVLGRFKSLRESCMSLMSQVRVDAIFLFPQNSPFDNRSDY